MAGLLKSRYSDTAGWDIGQIIPISIILVYFLAMSIIPQNNDYWKNAPLGETKIFTISFIDKQNGMANSADGKVLTTKDGGINWGEESAARFISNTTNSEFIWKADIYCAIMKTTDGGNSWYPYDEEKQEHFCGVYLKDENTGYKVASEFLNKVTMEINYYFLTNKLDSIIDKPNQCTEYYTNPEEGWALGWCLRNFNK